MAENERVQRWRVVKHTVAHLHERGRDIDGVAQRSLLERMFAQIGDGGESRCASLVVKLSHTLHVAPGHRPVANARERLAKAHRAQPVAIAHERPLAKGRHHIGLPLGDDGVGDDDVALSEKPLRLVGLDNRGSTGLGAGRGSRHGEAVGVVGRGVDDVVTAAIDHVVGEGGGLLAPHEGAVHGHKQLQPIVQGRPPNVCHLTFAPRRGWVVEVHEQSLQGGAVEHEVGGQHGYRTGDAHMLQRIVLCQCERTYRHEAVGEVGHFHLRAAQGGFVDGAQPFAAGQRQFIHLGAAIEGVCAYGGYLRVRQVDGRERGATLEGAFVDGVEQRLLVKIDARKQCAALEGMGVILQCMGQLHRGERGAVGKGIVVNPCRVGVVEDLLDVRVVGKCAVAHLVEEVTPPIDFGVEQPHRGLRHGGLIASRNQDVAVVALDNPHCAAGIVHTIGGCRIKSYYIISCN